MIKKYIYLVILFSIFRAESFLFTINKLSLIRNVPLSSRSCIICKAKKTTTKYTVSPTYKTPEGFWESSESEEWSMSPEEWKQKQDEKEYDLFWKALTTYQKIHGHLNVPTRYRVPKQNKYPKETWGFNLYAMIIKVRDQGFYSSFPERMERLDSIGFVWKGKKQGKEHKSMSNQESDIDVVVEKKQLTYIQGEKDPDDVDFDLFIDALELYCMKKHIKNINKDITLNITIPYTNINDDYPDHMLGLPLGVCLHELKHKGAYLTLDGLVEKILKEEHKDIYPIISERIKEETINKAKDIITRRLDRIRTFNIAIDGMKKTSENMTSSLLDIKKPVVNYTYKSDETFDLIVECFRIHTLIYGHLNIAYNFIVPSEAPWPRAFWSENLDDHYYSISRKHLYLDQRPDRVILLNMLGFNWMGHDNPRYDRKNKTISYIGVDSFIDQDHTATNISNKETILSSDELNKAMEEIKKKENDEKVKIMEENKKWEKEVQLDELISRDKKKQLGFLDIIDALKIWKEAFGHFENIDKDFVIPRHPLIQERLDRIEEENTRKRTSFLMGETYKELPSSKLMESSSTSHLDAVKFLPKSEEEIKAMTVMEYKIYDQQMKHQALLTSGHVIDDKSVSEVTGERLFEVDTEALIPMQGEVSTIGNGPPSVKQIERGSNEVEEEEDFEVEPELESLDLVEHSIYSDFDDEILNPKPYREKTIKKSRKSLEMEIQFNQTRDNIKWPLRLGTLKLGQYVLALRQGDYLGKLDPERRLLLDKIQFTWGDESRFQHYHFSSILRGLVNYNKLRSHMSIPDDFVVPSNRHFEKWIWGFELGKHINIMRASKEMIINEYPGRFEFLNELKIRWVSPVLVKSSGNIELDHIENEKCIKIIREKHKTYVDKTDYIQDLIDAGLMTKFMWYKLKWALSREGEEGEKIRNWEGFEYGIGWKGRKIICTYQDMVDKEEAMKKQGRECWSEEPEIVEKTPLYEDVVFKRLTSKTRT